MLAFPSLVMKEKERKKEKSSEPESGMVLCPDGPGILLIFICCHNTIINPAAFYSQAIPSLHSTLGIYSASPGVSVVSCLVPSPTAKGAHGEHGSRRNSPLT